MKIEEPLATWLLRLIKEKLLLRQSGELQSFLVYISEEEIYTYTQLVELYNEWSDEN